MEGPGEQTEHPDTPMRKRPRLEGGSGDETKTPGSRTPPPNSDDTLTHITSDGSSSTTRNATTSPLQTPSKVTLNLRSNDSSPILPQRSVQPVSDNAVSYESTGSPRGSTTPDFVVVEQSPQSDPDDVVEIEIDEPEDILSDLHGNLDGPRQEEDMLDIYRDLIQSFPPTRRRSSSLDKAITWVDWASQGEPVIASSELSQLIDRRRRRT